MSGFCNIPGSEGPSCPARRACHVCCLTSASFVFGSTLHRSRKQGPRPSQKPRARPKLSFLMYVNVLQLCSNCVTLWSLSHQDQWWLSCACALHFLAMRDVSLGCALFDPFFGTSSTPHHIYTYLKFLLPPLRHLVTSIYSMALGTVTETLPCGLSLQVYTQYPRPESFLLAFLFCCVRLYVSNYLLVSIRNLFRFACLVNSFCTAF